MGLVIVICLIHIRPYFTNSPVWSDYQAVYNKNLLDPPGGFDDIMANDIRVRVYEYTVTIVA